MKRFILAFCLWFTLFFLAACLRHRAPSPEPGPAAVKGTGCATLTWEAPTANIDDSPLTDLAGYNVYYGQVSAGPEGRKKKQLPLGDRDLCCEAVGGEESETRTRCSYTLNGLGAGAYYFRVTAYNRQGRESDVSKEVIKGDTTKGTCSSGRAEGDRR